MNKSKNQHSSISYDFLSRLLVLVCFMSAGVHGFAPSTGIHDYLFNVNFQQHSVGRDTSSSFDIKTKRRKTSLQNSAILDISFLPSTFENASSAYSYALAHYQLETQSVSTGILSGIGDTIAQLTENAGDDEKKREIKVKRTTAFIVKGLGSGFIWHFWYNIADSCGDMMFGIDHQSSIVQRTLLSILLEQFIACPIVYALWDIPIPALLNGSGFGTIAERVRERLAGLLFSNAKVWTFANTVIYNVPIEWRVLAMNVADLGWQVIASQSIMGDEENGEGEKASNQQTIAN